MKKIGLFKKIIAVATAATMIFAVPIGANAAQTSGGSYSVNAWVSSNALAIYDFNRTIYANTSSSFTYTFNSTLMKAVKEQTWESSDPSVVTVTANGLKGATVNGISPGKARITGTVPVTMTDGGVRTFTKILDITVLESTIELPSSTTVYKGCSLAAPLTNHGIDASTITWTSSNTSVATVSAKGVIKGLKEGTTVIKATSGTITTSCKVTVAKPTIKFASKSTTISKGKSRSLSVTVKGPNQKVTWKSSKSSVVSVNSKGKITAHKYGTATITAKANGVKATCKVKVVKTAVPDVIAAYQKVLKKKYNSSSAFCLAYVDGDSIPEMIVGATYEVHVDVPTVYTYVNGKVKAYKYAGSDYSGFYYVPKKGIVDQNAWANGYGAIDTYYKLSKGKAKQLVKIEDGSASLSPTYKINGKTVSASAYSAKAKSLKKKYKLYYIGPSNRVTCSTENITLLGTNYKKLVQKGTKA